MIIIEAQGISEGPAKGQGESPDMTPPNGPLITRKFLFLDSVLTLSKLDHCRQPPPPLTPTQPSACLFPSSI